MGTLGKPNAHRRALSTVQAVLIARSEYFRSMFRKGEHEMQEGKTSAVQVPTHDVRTVKQMLEFLYSCHVAGLESAPAADLTRLLALADQFLLDDLKRFCQHTARQIMDTSNVMKLLAAADEYNAPALSKICLNFIVDNLPEITKSEPCEAEVMTNPRLAWAVMRFIAGKQGGASSDVDGSGAGGASSAAGAGSGGKTRGAKRRRISQHRAGGASQVVDLADEAAASGSSLTLTFQQQRN